MPGYRFGQTVAMDAILTTRLAVNAGVASVTELARLGVSRHVVDDAVRRGDLVRLRRNVVVLSNVWRAAAPWDRHAIRARATIRALGPSRALSHHSALAVQGVPVHGVDDHVHVVRTDGRRARGTGATVGHAGVPETFLATVDDLRVVDGALACLQVADLFGVEAGLVSADALLRTGTARQRLAEALAAGRFGRGAPHARTVTSIADARMESAGESRARWLFRVVGLPDPELQVWIRDGERFAARVDFLFREHRTIVEFDGMLKYATQDDLRDEKAREDRLRELGYEVVRITWADLANPAEVRAKILAAFARAGRRGC